MKASGTKVDRKRVRVHRSSFIMVIPTVSFAFINLASLVWLVLIVVSGAHGVGYLSPQQPVPADTLITLTRSACRGSCPDYKVSVSADGTVIYRGRQFVRIKRLVRAKIAPEKLRELIAQFEQANFFSLNSKYAGIEDGCPGFWTDNPEVVTTIRIDGKSKSVYHYHGCKDGQGTSIYPKGLTDLENRIDEIVGTKQ